MQITFNETQLHLVEHTQHEFLLSNKEVALGYGITENAIIKHLGRRSDELIEDKHWLRLEVQTKGGKQKVIHWTKKGIVRLGFFIKSKQAKEFRDWAEDYIVNNRATKTQLDMITPYEVRRDLATARRLLTLEKKKHRATAEYFEAKIQSITNDTKLQCENKRLKHTLIDFSNRYHTIVLEADNQIEAMRSEIEKMTNCFQLLPNLANDGKNLNTDTVAKHSYW